MATKIRYVNTASTAGGDGTTNDTVGANRAFVSLQAALSDSPTDLTGTTCTEADELGRVIAAYKIFCTGVAPDTASVTSNSGWITDDTHQIVIVGNSSGSYWDNNAYHITVGANSPAIGLNVSSHYRLINIQAAHTGSLTGIGARVIDWLQNSRPKQSFINGVYYLSGSGTPNSNCRVISCAGSTQVTNSLFLVNTTFITSGTAMAELSLGSSTNNLVTCSILNCTFINMSASAQGGLFVAGGSVVNIKNVLIQGSGSSNDDYIIGTAPGILNTGSILTADASSPFTALRNKVVSFQLSTPLDYRLSPLDVSARNSGSNLAAEAYYSFSFDSSGQTRTDPWDIGSSEVTDVTIRAGTVFLLNTGQSNVRIGGNNPSTFIFYPR